MKQDTNRENLKKLLDFLRDRILFIPNNNWFAKELYQHLAPVSDARISDIHEQCIETILKEQAEEFYKDFVIGALRPQLISDFVKMEHWRRRANIQEFCMALYQQIEAITNYLAADNNLNLIWRNIRNSGFFIDIHAKDIRVRGAGKSIEKSIIFDPKNYGKELCELVAMDKFKAILFLIVYQTYVDWNNRVLFNTDFDTGYNIYTARNLNHRGNNIDGTVPDRISNIMNNPTFAMCILLGFYARFISGINNNFPVSSQIVELAEICCKKDSQ